MAHLLSFPYIREWKWLSRKCQSHEKQKLFQIATELDTKQERFFYKITEAVSDSEW